MNKWTLSFAALIFLSFAFSCKKNGSSGGGPAVNNNAYLSSASSFSDQLRVVDSFTYDNSHRITRFAQYAYDTTGGYPVLYGYTTDFTFSGAATTPIAYVYANMDGTGTDVHQLSYDAQGRIIKDTSISGSGFVTFYSYPNNIIASLVLFDGTQMNNQIDTLYTSNGNIGAERIYYPNDAGTADTLSGSLQFLTYSSVVNPAYHANIVTSVGPLLFTLQFDGYANFLDPISQYIFTKVAGTDEQINTPITLNYKTVLDNQGRLAELLPTTPGVNQYFTYSYYP